MTGPGAGGDRRDRLGELAWVFARLGCLAFGGPAAHLAMLEDEVVTRRAWLTREHFLDLVGATNLIPGPNSTEMALHVGYERAGWAGLAVAGTCFIVPAVVLTAALAWVYVAYGSLPEVAPFLYGIQPAVIALIVGAVWKLGQKAVRDVRRAAIALVVFGAVVAGVGEVPALLGGGAAGMLWLRPGGAESARARVGGVLLPLVQGAAGPDTLGSAPGSALGGAVGTAAVVGVSLSKLGLFFLKVGAVLYGSGYVLVAFLEGGLVETYGWLTRAQLLDAVAAGQFTPGPVLSTATFVGYVLGGFEGAAVATLAIFLPSFVFVLVLNPLVPRLRRSAWTAAFLDAVNVASVALLLAAVVDLGATSLATWPSRGIAAAAAVLLLRFRVNAAWLVLGGGLAGWLLALAG